MNRTRRWLPWLLPLAGCSSTPHAERLHWFVPDGVRCDPTTFDVYQWAQDGRLPNIARIMETGTYGYSIPAFPSHTPANFATLMTGAPPSVNGVADGPMHLEGAPLDHPAVSGFSSVARQVPAAWALFEAARKAVFVLSVPGSTPPELGPGSATVRGRWGGWGADSPSVIFERDDPARRKALSRSTRLFLVGEELTRFVTATPAGPPAPGGTAALPPLHLDLPVAGVPLTANITPGASGYERLDVTAPGSPAVSLRAGDWSPWLPVTLDWKGTPVASHLRVEVIRLDADGFFRVRVLVDSLNRLLADPPEVADALEAKVGPMVDFVDSYPAQLVAFPEDKQAFLAEAQQSLVWHRDAVDAVYDRYTPDVFIHSIYTPNQMLTSRWWMGSVDPASKRYSAVTDTARKVLWDEVIDMYHSLDEIVGRALERADATTLVVVSSDHGAVPLDRTVRLNNLFAQRGWLTEKVDPATGAPVVDWERSRVVFLSMDHVYVRPEGLGGDWHRGSGEAYLTLRAEVEAAIRQLTDEDGRSPLASVTPWEHAAAELHLPPDRVGDLVIANQPGFGWTEDITDDGVIFATPLVSGYKQAIPPDTTPGLWTPFLLTGPGIRAGHRLSSPVHAVDQLPTILTAMQLPVPSTVTGHVVEEALLPR